MERWVVGEHTDWGQCGGVSRAGWRSSKVGGDLSDYGGEQRADERRMAQLGGESASDRTTGEKRKGERGN